MSDRHFPVDQDAIEEMAARLDLREPNRLALETTAYELYQHFESGKTPPMEAVLDAATGVGKTYILVGAIEYLAQAHGARNFAVIAPGRTILNKTIANLRPGNPKSLVGGMQAKPLVVTSDNFATPAMRAEMDDPMQVKVFVFTVQALTKPTTKTGRKAHKFQEGLGAGLYEHLQACEDLVVFADEHHCYYGPTFSRAVRDLAPVLLLGLTATPHKKTPEEDIIFRYPLAAAIAEEYVKTPVVVGRTDDRADPETKLRDGVTLLEYKAEAIRAYCERSGEEPVNPVMLVIAQSIEDANEYGAVFHRDTFFGGVYADRILVVHSNAPDEALEALEKVEEPDSPVRVIISVGMLKEGWDVKNVYVIASMRSSISDVLTEQTLGRGLRLPFGRYTDVEILDTLEVLAHERYDALLRKAGAINEAFIDHRTRAVLKQNAKGEWVSVRQTGQAGKPVVVDRGGPSGGTAHEREAMLASVEQRTGHVKEETLRMSQEVEPRKGVAPIEVPRLRMGRIESAFSLADITDHKAFRELGSQMAANPEEAFRRTVVGARVIEGPDGLKRTELVTSEGADQVEVQKELLPLEDSIEYLRQALLASPMIPARKGQAAMAEPLIEALLAGLGDGAREVLSSYRERATARFLRLVGEEQRRHAPKPLYEEVVSVERIDAKRTNSRLISADRAGRFSRSAAYEGWAKSVYPIEWFDSAPERELALALDGAGAIDRWVRLHRGELPIVWRNKDREYHADFIVVETDKTHWVVEVKSDKGVTTEEVRAKREAAKRWANYVNASNLVPVRWRYLLISERDLKDAKGSWDALKALGSA